MENTVNINMEDFVDITFEAVEKDLENLQDPINEGLKLIKNKLKDILLKDDKNLYEEVIDKLDKTYNSIYEITGKGPGVDKIKEVRDNIVKQVNSFKEKHESTGKAMDFIGDLIRHLAMIILGVTKFVIDTTCVVGLCVARVLARTTNVIIEENIVMVKAVGKSFNKNILSIFRKKQK